MSVDFDGLFFYGMPIEGELDDDLLDTFWENHDHPLEFMNLTPYSSKNYMLFVRESYHSGDKHSEEKLVKLSDVVGKEAEWRQLIVDTCIANGLTFAPPDWYFATMFS